MIKDRNVSLLVSAISASTTTGTNLMLKGFDFLRSGKIVLKAYYIPCARQPFDAPNTHKASRMRLWDVDYKPLRSLVTILDPTLIKSLNMMISYAEESNMLSKPRLQILSMDCVSNEANRLKVNQKHPGFVDVLTV